HGSAVSVRSATIGQMLSGSLPCSLRGSVASVATPSPHSLRAWAAVWPYQHAVICCIFAICQLGFREMSGQVASAGLVSRLSLRLPGGSMSAARHRCETLVIGAGLAGISTALELLDQGSEVLLLDAVPRSHCGGQANDAF